jgi:hypothetical protein
MTELLKIPDKNKERFHISDVYDLVCSTAAAIGSKRWNDIGFVSGIAFSIGVLWGSNYLIFESMSEVIRRNNSTPLVEPITRPITIKGDCWRLESKNTLPQPC